MNRSKPMSLSAQLFSYCALTSVIILVCGAAATADPVVALGTYDFNTGLTQQAIPIYGYNDPASGNLAPFGYIAAIDLNVGIADEGGHASNGGPVFHLGSENAPGTRPISSGYVGGNTITTM